MSPYVGLFFDIVMLVALGATIAFSLRLSRQFNQMRADRRAFETLISHLNTASSRAEASVKSFKEMATGNGDALQDKINRARALSDELEIMIQAGDSLADRLQAAASSRRAGDDAQVIAEGLQPRTKAEKELLEAVRAKQARE